MVSSVIILIPVIRRAWPRFVRVLLDATHPLTAGVGSEAFMYFRDSMPIMRPLLGGPRYSVGYFPDGEDPDWCQHPSRTLTTGASTPPASSAKNST